MEKGLLTIGDLLDTGQMYSIDHIRDVLHLKCDFLLYDKLRKRVQLTIGNNIISDFDNLHPQSGNEPGPVLTASCLSFGQAVS